MKKSSCRSAAASLKCQAPQTFPAKTRSTSASSRLLSGVVPISPAAWTMPANGGSSACTVANRRATSCASATSAATTRNSQPCCSPNASMRCCAASLGARRLVSTRCLAPCAARYPAISSPIEPSPPVTRYVASARSSSGVAARLPGPSNQPGNVDRLITQRDLVFPDGRVARRRDPVDEPRPFVGSCLPTDPPVRPTRAEAPATRRDRIPTGNSDPAPRCPRR